MQLVIAEKPSVANSIADVLGANERCDGYRQGNGYYVSWCVGHLVELEQPQAYGEQYEKWNYDTLPIMPDEWKYEVKKDVKKQQTQQQLSVKVFRHSVFQVQLLTRERLVLDMVI